MHKLRRPHKPTPTKWYSPLLGFELRRTARRWAKTDEGQVVMAAALVHQNSQWSMGMRTIRQRPFISEPGHAKFRQHMATHNVLLQIVKKTLIRLRRVYVMSIAEFNFRKIFMPHQLINTTRHIIINNIDNNKKLERSVIPIPMSPHKVYIYI